MSRNGPLVGIIDYEAGNLYNVAHALKALGVRSIFSSDVGELKKCDRIVLPGVGAASAAMKSLSERGLVDFLRETERPLLGICLGMQLLFGRSEEDGTACLDRLDGSVVRFETGTVKVPHIGWNQVAWTSDCALASAIPPDEFFYFVHSYFVDPAESALVCGRTDYGRPFAAAVHRHNLWGVQFHPERSGPSGLRMLRNFVDWGAA